MTVRGFQVVGERRETLRPDVAVVDRERRPARWVQVLTGQRRKHPGRERSCRDVLSAALWLKADYLNGIFSFRLGELTTRRARVELLRQASHTNPPTFRYALAASPLPADPSSGGGTRRAKLSIGLR